LVIGTALALARRARPLGRWLPLPGVFACLALGFAWWPAVERRTPGFVWYTVIDNHLLNVARVRQFPDEDVPLSVAQFLAVALLGATPWILSAGAALWALVRQRAWRDPRETAWVALGLWAVGGLAITALSPFRLPHYGLPAYFAVALLAARGWESHGGRRLVAAHALVLGAPERRRVRRARPDARAPSVDRRRARPGLRPSRGGGGRPRARSARRAGGPDRPRGSARELGRARMVLGPPRGDRGGAEECARLRRAPPRGARRVLGRGATREGLGGWPRVGRKRAPA